MPAGDGTGPYGTYKNCVQIKSIREEFYRRPRPRLGRRRRPLRRNQRQS